MIKKCQVLLIVLGSHVSYCHYSLNNCYRFVLQVQPKSHLLQTALQRPSPTSAPGYGLSLPQIPVWEPRLPPSLPSGRPMVIFESDSLRLHFWKAGPRLIHPQHLAQSWQPPAGWPGGQERTGLSGQGRFAACRPLSSEASVSAQDL